MSWPTGVTVPVRLRVGTPGDDDADSPDWRPLIGAAAILEPSIRHVAVTYPDGKVVADMVAPIHVTFDADGNLLTVDDRQPARVLATEGDHLSVTGWIWTLHCPERGLEIPFSARLDDGTVELADYLYEPAVDGPSSWVGKLPDLIEAADRLEDVVGDVTEIRDEAVAARDAAVPAADRAEQARDATLTAATWTLTGPGRPDQPATTGGIITGTEPVGTDYRSTDGAGIGAWAWRKRPSGWAYTDFDTGWRDFSSYINSAFALAPSSGIAAMRRVGDRVSARLTLASVGVVGMSVWNHLLEGIPAAWRPATLLLPLGVATVADRPTVLYGQTAGRITVRNAADDARPAPGAAVSVDATWVTQATLPTASDIPPPR